MYLLEFLRFRIGLHLSGVIFDFGTEKSELTYCPCRCLTSIIAPFLRSSLTSVLIMLEALANMVGLHAAILCLGALPIQESL